MLNSNAYLPEPHLKLLIQKLTDETWESIINKLPECLLHLLNLESH